MKNCSVGKIFWFNDFYFLYGLGVMPIAAEKIFWPLALKKAHRKPRLSGIFHCAILLHVGHNNVIIILDLPVLLELNNINQN